MSEIKWKENKTLNITEIVNTCEKTKEPCKFPYCEMDLACETKTLQEAMDETTEEPAPNTDENKNTNTTITVDKPADNVAVFFECQNQINQLNQEKTRLEKAKKEAFDKLKTDIQTVFIALDCEDFGTKITLTDKGLNISYPVRVFNKYQTTLVDTDLFTQLNNLMGMKGKLSMAEETKVAGNFVRIIELIYEV